MSSRLSQITHLILKKVLHLPEVTSALRWVVQNNIDRGHHSTNPKNAPLRLHDEYYGVGIFFHFHAVFCKNYAK